MADDMKQPEGGMKFSGKAPPQFFQTLQAIKKAEASQAQEAKIAQQKNPFSDVLPEEAQEAMAPPPPQQPPKIQQAHAEAPARPQQKLRTVGSSHLEGILEKLRGQSFVYYDINLPSKGVFYNGNDGPTDGVLHIRPMTGEEEQILATPTFVRKGSAINMIFQRCVKETIKPEKLLSVDRTCLLIWLRGISYGHEYEVEIKCPECTKKFPHTIMLNSLMVNYCPDNLAPPLTDVMPKSGLNFSWHLPRGEDENVVNNYREKRNKEYGDSAIDDSLLYRVSLMLDDVEGLRDKTELMILLKKLPIQDVSYLRSLASEPPFGVDTNCPIMCPLCFHEFDVDLPLEAGFFFPRHKRKTGQTS